MYDDDVLSGTRDIIQTNLSHAKLCKLNVFLMLPAVKKNDNNIVLIFKILYFNDFV